MHMWRVLACGRHKGTVLAAVEHVLEYSEAVGEMRLRSDIQRCVFMMWTGEHIVFVLGMDAESIVHLFMVTGKMQRMAATANGCQEEQDEWLPGRTRLF